MGIERTFCSLGGAAAGATGPPQILLTAKGTTAAGCAQTVFVCLRNGEGGDTKRIIQVTF